MFNGPTFKESTGDMHYKLTGDELPLYGQPDDGNGRYTAESGYGNWYFLNVRQRIYMNDLEHLVTFAPLSLVNGLIYPWATTGLLATYFTGRYFYHIGYLNKDGAEDPKRTMGSVICVGAVFGTVTLSTVLALRMITGKLCLQKALGLIAK
jgi:hypothetical protein